MFIMLQYDEWNLLSESYKYIKNAFRVEVRYNSNKYPNLSE